MPIFYCKLSRCVLYLKIFIAPLANDLAYLEEDLDAVDEEKDDDDEHEDGVAAVEDVSVELTVLVFDPHLKIKLLT